MSHGLPARSTTTKGSSPARPGETLQDVPLGVTRRRSSLRPLYRRRFGFSLPAWFFSSPSRKSTRRPGGSVFEIAQPLLTALQQEGRRGWAEKLGGEGRD